MEMTFRWYGSDFDTVTLKQIQQIAGVTGVITTLYDKKAGEVWKREEIRGLIDEVEAAGLHVSGIESVNIHDAIKAGLPERDLYINNYIETLENLGKEGIHLVCYNFMLVFDWTRTELARKRADGSTVLAYTQEAVDALQPEKMFASIAGDANGSVMPGWEPERMVQVKELFALYQNVSADDLFEDLKYFLEKIMPVCADYHINMAIHPDDPAWSVFGLPRIITCKENILRMMHMVYRETVDKVEKMKVCTCLNPLHTCLAIFGCLLGYTKISDEMKDRELVKLVETVGYQEGLPVVVNPGILDPKEFLDTVLRVRVPNPFMPDTPQRIATDTSQKKCVVILRN